MTPQEAQAGIAKTLADQAQADELGLKAASKATPGPMRKAFSPVPDITVGPYVVRRFRDGDFIFLDQLGHPFNKYAAVETYGFEPSGDLAWQLCWIFTRTVAEVRGKLASCDTEEKSVKLVKDLARDEFSEFNMQEIGEIMMAIACQFRIYTGAEIAYKAKEIAGDEKSGPPSAPPNSSTE